MKSTSKTLKKTKPLKQSNTKPRKKRAKQSQSAKNETRPISSARRSTTLPKKKSKRVSQSKVTLNKKRKKQRRQFFKEIGVSFFLMLLLFFILKGLFFSMPKVNGYAMTTTLNDGDRLFVRKHVSIKRFDLVYFKQPNTNRVMIRRVIGLPGEEVTYENDQLMINQKLVVERFLKNEINEAAKENRLLTENFTLAELIGSRTLPDKSYFVLGDNRHYASDSRDFGSIDQKDIVGVVKARILPLHHMIQY